MLKTFIKSKCNTIGTPGCEVELIVHYGEKLQIHRNDEKKAQPCNEKVQLCNNTVMLYSE